MESLFGQLTKWVANTGFRTTEKPVNTEDFMPSHWAKLSPTNNPLPARTKITRMNAKRRTAVANSLRALFPLR